MSALEELDPATRLGRAVVSRLRLPGPPRGRERPSRIGSVASSSIRFAAAAGRPAEVRRSLRGPGLARVNSFSEAGTRPPRWWTPPEAAFAPDHEGARTASFTREVRGGDLPERGLPRAVRNVPNEQTWTPGGIVGSLVSSVAPVRRLDEVSAAGAMLTQHDRSKLSAVTAARASSTRRERSAELTTFRSYSGRTGPAGPPSLRSSAVTPPRSTPPPSTPPRSTPPRSTPPGSTPGSTPRAGGTPPAASPAPPLRRST
ncbi:MAG: hypothetical protein M3N95_11805, partial [Actinomycetota bacterium]|nr:hypothetical protein [Actinomycetota bacterium]